jgi:lycopene cyclase domain-containing protein
VIPPVDSSYLVFLGCAVGVPTLVVALLAWRLGGLRTPTDVAGVGALVLIAFGYTFVWDGYLIERGVWWYGNGVVTARVGVIPLGELAFFALQTALTGCWLHAIDPPVEPTRPATASARPVGLLVIAALELAGLVLSYTTAGYYLGYILLWGCPILGFLWVLGGPLVRRRRRSAAVAILVPTAYLWTIDRVAIGRGLWTISPTHSTGVAVAGLPVEEMVFFLVTNTLIVFGLLLYRWVIGRAERDGLVAGLVGLFPRGGVGAAAE